MAETFTFTIKPITDLSDVKANVGEIQKAFSKLKLPDKLTGKLTNEIAKFDKAYAIVQKKMAEGIKTPGDLTQLQKNNNIILNSWNEISKIIHEVSGLNLSDVFKFDTKNLQEAKKQLADLEKQLNGIALNKTQTNQLQKAIENVQAQTKSTKIQDLTQGMLDGLNEGKFAKVFDNYDKLKQHHLEFIHMFGSKTTTAINTLGTTLERTTGSTGNLTQKIGETRQEVERLTQAAEQEARIGLENSAENWEAESAAVQKYTESVEDAGKAELELSKNAQTLERQVESYFGLNAIFRKVATMAREAMQTVKELDKAMTETAVVTDFSVADMWEKLPIYTAEANKLGSTIKDVYEATTLYYQQGLNTAQSMGLAEETLKMARIAGMDAKDATDAMTAALRGFNLELNQTSAKRINDVYSELAAITASDTQEISTAMEKVASLAHNAGMEVETTSAFLAQMIETTREAPENLGTALKTVVARFQEMKEDPTKLIDSEGVMLDANKVDKALKSIGVNLMDANGEFRKLDDVFLEIASKWDSLSKGQQRYIATMAAGSRQQSRFIAMMSDYGRTMELVNAANNAAGASQKQFEKTLESMDTKLNQLKNAWDLFTMGLMNNNILKSVVDFGTSSLDTINKIINAISGGNGLIKSIITLGATFAGLTGARTILNAGISGGFKWFKGELDTKGLFTNILLSGRKNIQEQFSKAGVTGADNFEKGFRGRFQKNFQQGFQYSLRNLNNSFFKNAVLGKVPIEFDQEQVRQKLIKAVNNSGDNPVAASALKVMGKESLVDYAKRNNLMDALGPTKEIIESYEKLNTAAGKFAVGTTKAGSALQSFGLLLRGTPLAPFGMALQVAGTGLSSFGQLFVQVGKNGEILSTGLAAIKANLAGFAPYIAVFTALAIGITAVYLAVTENKRRLEELSKVAQDASNNLDTLKQNATEFKSSLEQIQANKDAFKDLVPGTLEFNEKLIESNQLILDIINTYDELKNKLRFDEFGRAFIPEDDLNEFYKTLQQRQQIGQSLSLITDFKIEEEKARQENAEKRKTYTYNEHGNIFAYEYVDAADEIIEELDEKDKELMAKQQSVYSSAIQNAIAGLDIDNSSTANVLAQQYERYLEKVGKLTDEEAIEIYARQNNLSTADVASNDDLKNFAIKEAPMIKALQNIYDNAEKVDNILESVDQNVYSVFEEEFGDNKTFFTDLFSRNKLVDTDLLKQFNLSDNWAQKMVDSLSDEMVLEFEPEFDEESIDKARKTLKKDLEEAGQDLLEIQKPIYTDFASLYIRSGAASKTNPNKFGKVTALYEASAFRESIEEDLKQISVEKAEFITEVASELETHVGNDATAEFMSNAVSIYSSGVSSRIQELETILTGVSWDSAISRLETYDAMIESSDGAIHQLGESLYGAAEEANLLGEAVYEAFTSESFQDLYQKRDDYVNSFGKFDAAGIKKMQAESSTLARLLDTGTISANGLATALNTLEDTGSLDGLTSAVLELISEFDSLGEVMSDAHNIISSFDPGIDTGEGEDFIKKNYEAVKEYWDNFEVGNEQLINYLKLYAGEDRWNKLSQKYNGNLEKIERAILNGDKEHSAMSLFAEGFEEAWIKGANEKYSQNGISLGWDKGFIDLDIGDKTTDEVVAWLQEVYGISEEYAKLMLTDFENYSADLRRDLARNDWNKALPDFINKKTRENGTTVLTQEEVDVIASARGVSVDQVLKEIKKRASDLQVFDMNDYQNKEGNIDYAKALQDWLDKTVGTRNEKGQLEKDSGDIREYLEETGDKVNELAGAVTDMQSSGIPLSDTQEMLYSKVAGTDGQYTYKGVALTDKDTKTLDSFVNKMAEIDQDEQWTKVGNAICRGWFEEYDKRNNNETPKQDTTKSQSTMATTDTNTDGGNHTKEVDVTIDKTVNEEINTTENYDNAESNDKRDDTISKEQKITELTNKPKKEVIETTEAQQRVNNLKEQINFLKDRIAQRESMDLDSTAAKQALDSLNIKLQTAKERLQELRNNSEIKIRITQDGAVPKPARNGLNNYIPHSGYYAGSAANGRYGTVGPKNKGGLTLTGEEGFEIAWIPSENRSMILGAQGPQLTNLPSDTVVYTHEQSKKIVKQKGIPAGSHSKRHIHTGGSGSGSSSNSGSKDDKNKTSNKDDNKHTNWQDVEIDRYNLNQKINKITQKIEDKTKAIDKALEKIGTSYSTIADDVKTQVKFIKNNIAYQEDLQKSYKKGLKDIDNNKRSIWVGIESKSTDKNGDAKTETKDKKINIGKYVSKDKNGAYVVDKNKIKKDYSSRTNQEAVFNAIQSEIDKLTSGYDNATKAIKEYKDQLDEITKKVADAFFNWENELTRIYELNNQIEAQDARRARLTSESSMLMAQIGAGYATAASAGKRLIQIQKQDATLLAERIKLTQQDIKAKREQLAKDVSYKDEKTRYNEIKAANKKKKASGKALSVKDQAKEDNAYDDYLAAKYSGKYIKRTKLKDGSYKIDFNEKQLERDKNRGKISDKTYEAIKEGYDKLVQSNADYQEAIQSGFDYLTEVYEQYSEYVKTMADLESDLIDAFEKQAQKEVDKLQSINTALTNATKKIIEQVKKNLDARRRAEDNAKTEADISKKQQRLAVLRANTSGGNAVEIAQLEKEVGDAQQSYGRTLEDQLLNNMQQQADQAAQQRQEQIDLAKQQIEYNKEAGVYAKQADKLLRDVKGNASKIKNVLNITKDESTGKWGKQVWETEVQTKIAEGITASEGIKTLKTQLGKDSSAFNTLEASLTGLNKKETKKAGGKKGTKQTGGKKDKSKKNKSSNGSKTKDTKSSKKKQQKGSNFYSGLETTYSGLEIIYSSLDRENPSAAGYLSSLPNRELKTKEEIQQLQRGINTLVEADLLPGIKKLNGKGIYASKTKAAVLALQQALGVKNAQGIWNSETSAALRKNKKLKYYQSGGLADSTGPAWLDGTKSRPELVLNSTDTKNFIILKDILSDTMRNLSHAESSDIYNSPTEVNINVNVDKISNDYDVKRLASTLKKEIVKDASYRNVTTVRKFR